MEFLKMRHDNGFSLIELLVAMTIAGIVIGGIYSVYHTQQKSFLVQEQVTGMQQNIRAALLLMEREIRRAGYDPTRNAGAGITTASATSIRFTMDIHDGVDNDADSSIDESDEAGNGDGDITDPNEDITYLRIDPDGDGVFDLYRRDATVAGDQLVAENIDAIDFIYLDGDGNITPTLSNMSSVQITLVARTDRIDRGYIDTTSYTNQQGTVILPQQNDGFRRKRLTAEVKCRNLDLL
jgi:type IV pilus assembly protein PilW